MITKKEKQKLMLFWLDKRDLSCWPQWSKKKAKFQKECPALIEAWEDYQVAKVMVTLAIDSL